MLGVSEDRYAIGYSGMGYSTSSVKKLRIAEKTGAPFVEAEAARVLDDTYPLRRFLFVYINRAPNKPSDPLLREFVTYVFSREGQEVVSKDGFIPVPAPIAEVEARKVR